MADLVSQVVADLRAWLLFAGQPRKRAEAARAAIEAGLTSQEWGLALDAAESLVRRDSQGREDRDNARSRLYVAVTDREALEDLVECAREKARRTVSGAPSHYCAGPPPSGLCAHGIPPTKPCRECDPPLPPASKRPASPDRRAGRPRAARRAER